jgi:3-dehydroquinate dehydratase-2
VRLAPVRSRRVTTVFVLNGPNLNLLGTREPAVYGTSVLADVERLCRDTAAELGLTVEFRQSNREGELVDWLHEAGAAVAAGTSIGVVLNAAAYSHTSIALPDAIEGAQVPTVEVHISNVHKREEFRHHSYVSAVSAGIVVGFGVLGYALAIRGLHELHGG